MEVEFETHLSKPPDRSATRGVISEYQEKDAFLSYELRRYRTYSTHLKIKLQQQLGAQVLDKVVKGALLTTSKSSKPLTSLAIGEETVDDSTDHELDGNSGSQIKFRAEEEAVIKPVKHRSANQLRSKNSSNAFSTR
jgi:hypothetical protein